MSKRGNDELVEDIFEATRRLEIYSQDKEYGGFLEDLKTQDAVIRNFEIIGEAAKNITDDFKEKYPDIPWKDLAGIRDKLIHHYFGVNLEIVWYILKDDLPLLKDEIKRILEKKMSNKGRC
ncbi:MAG: DUF86 domain-containing protein [Candidatus Methanoperedens sp.]|nr:DUF86 domain-containing protein [Candidatus Methanoperedens sp.]